jgi:signal transduction histidine kinase
VISEVLVHMEGLVGAQLEEKELSYNYRCGNSSIVANADAAKVQQILLNLLANAIKFTDRGGAITLECEEETEAVAIRVMDTGRGIPPDKLDAIFQPFVQLKPRGAVTNGTGLGLPISRRLAMAMGGSLDAASEPGKGSTFTLRLQRAS